MKVFNVGVIGCGAIAQIMHIPCILAHPGLRLHSLYHASQKTLDACATKYGLSAGQCFLDYAELLKDSQLDLVVISTVDHYGPSLAASRAGIPQLIEKPLAFSPAQCDDMLREADAHGVWQAMGYMKCYDPNFLYFAGRVKAMPDLTYVRAHNFAGDMGMINALFGVAPADDVPGEWKAEGKRRQRAELLRAIGGSARADKLNGYFTLLAGATHDMACLRTLLGACTAVDGAAVNGDLTVALLRYGDVRCTFESDFLWQRKVWDESVDAYGQSCHAGIDFCWPYFKNGPSVIRLNTVDAAGNGSETRMVHSYDAPFGNLWKHMYDCLAGGEAPEVNARGGRADVALAVDMIRAAR